jgi:hypothetical protein
MIPYRTAKIMEGAKSTGRGVPPTGVGNLELIGWKGWVVKFYCMSEHIYDMQKPATPVISLYVYPVWY